MNPVPAHPFPPRPYAPPVSALLALGDVEGGEEWQDYPALGLGPEHVPELIRLGTDEDVYFDDSEPAPPSVYAPIHAWRALGELRAEAAAPALLPLLDEWADSDWPGEELPEIFARIGAAAIPALAAFLHEETHDLYARIHASEALEKLALRWGAEDPQARTACVAALARTLGKFAINAPELNGFLISSLTVLRADGALPLIERAFATEAAVDCSIMGDWEDAQVSFGLKPARETPRPNYVLESLERHRPPPGADTPWLPPRPGTGHAPGAGKREKKSKNRKKIARQSRQRNRRR